jgi:hypothetical protein
VSRFLRPFIAEYDAVIFTMAEFLLESPEADATRPPARRDGHRPLAHRDVAGDQKRAEA